MTFPPPPPSAQSSIASSSDKTPTSRILRTQPSAWGQPGQQSGARRGLTPLSTNNLTSTSSQSRRPTSSNSPSQNPLATSPVAPTFSAVASSRGLVGNRNSSSPSSASPFTSFQSGSHQQPAISSPRSRAITPSSASNLGSGVTPVYTTSGAGGGSGPGGGGGTSRSTPFTPSLSGNISSPTAFSFDKAATVAPGLNSANSNTAKITVAQVFLLLDSITEKEGKVKWESKAEQIRKVSLTHSRHTPIANLWL